VKRRLFVASTISSALAACAPIGTALNNNSRFHNLIGSAQPLNHALIDTHGLAKEYSERDISPEFPLDSLPTPSDANYTDLMRGGFRDYKLIVDGAVQRRGVFPFAMLERMCNTTLINRHDCVEGWSVVAKWSGIRLSAILDLVEPRSDARYVVFHCLDKDDQGTLYYESLDLHQARHPQTILAMRMNNRPVSPDHGGPVRLKVATQLGYKSAKWVSRIEVVGSFANIYAGNGGYWEDQGYEWYAGI
jgi:DMSO/TMAO reductase YedYZ molybdopterin-dependent catalytic subunit